jgi:hypothetical protein
MAVQVMVLLAFVICLFLLPTLVMTGHQRRSTVFARGVASRARRIDAADTAAGERPFMSIGRSFAFGALTFACLAVALVTSEPTRQLVQRMFDPSGGTASRIDIRLEQALADLDREVTRARELDAAVAQLKASLPAGSQTLLRLQEASKSLTERVRGFETAYAVQIDRIGQAKADLKHTTSTLVAALKAERVCPATPADQRSAPAQSSLACRVFGTCGTAGVPVCDLLASAP